MWQKERLLNLALSSLPPTCTKVVSLDCDLIFSATDWANRVSVLLDEVPLLQPFRSAYRTPPNWEIGQPVPPECCVLHAASYLIEGGMSVDDTLRGKGDDIGCAHGMAWAARRKLMEDRGFYDANIIGGGDTCLFRAAYGYMGLVVERFRFDDRRERHYRQWAEPFHADTQGRVGYAGGDIYHLWHGSQNDRHYDKRHEGLAALRFDPYEDIEKSITGAWRWSSHKPGLHRYLRDYFNSRNEDG
jgi:hypothetical protein